MDKRNIVGLKQIKSYLKKIHKTSIGNYGTLEKYTDPVGCFFCVSILNPEDIEFSNFRYEILGDRATATILCPKCGIDSVIIPPSEMKDHLHYLLAVMHERYFWD